MGNNNEYGIFGIIRVNANNVNNYSTNSLFYNVGETIINTENTWILGNKLSSNNHDSYLFYNNYNGYNYYSLENRSYTEIDSKNIYISNNELSSTERDSVLFNNKGMLKLGSDETEMLEIKENKRN